MGVHFKGCMKYPHCISALLIGCACSAAAGRLYADEPYNRLNAIASDSKTTLDPADESPFERAARDTSEDDGAGPRITAGMVFSSGLERGYFGRFESEWFNREGLTVYGVLLGLEGFGGNSGGGGAAPASMYYGVRAPLLLHKRAPCFFFTIGVGVDLLVIDYVADDFGLGLTAPFATGTLGLELFPGGRILGDARFEYRWQWGAPDRLYSRYGLTLSVNSDWWDNSDGGPSFGAAKRARAGSSL